MGSSNSPLNSELSVLIHYKITTRLQQGLVVFRPESSLSGMPALLNVALQPHRRWDSTGGAGKGYFI